MNANFRIFFSDVFRRFTVKPAMLQIRTKSNMDISLTSKTRTIAYDIDYEVNTMQDCRKVAEAFTKFYYSMQKYINCSH